MEEQGNSTARDTAFLVLTGDETPFDSSPRLTRVRRYVKDHISERIRLSDAAGAAGLERRYFSTYFHRRTGIKFREWLAILRVARAIELIRDRDLSLEQVRRACGFGDRRTFQRTFKRWVGITPSSFRKTSSQSPEWVEVARWIRQDAEASPSLHRRRLAHRF